MSIHLKNYEVYLIDYLDGNLPMELERELMLFLDKNPDIRSELKGLQNVELPKDEVVFNDKKELKQKEIFATATISETNYEEFFIAYYENDLSLAGKKETAEFVQKNPELAKEFKLHESLLLEAENIEYAHKNKLKKKRAILLWQYQTLAAVASIALLISLLWLIQPKQDYLNESRISYAQPRNTIIHNTLNQEIKSRGTVAKSVISTKISIEKEKINNQDTEKAFPINSIKRQYSDLAVVGEIDCAKPRYHKHHKNKFPDLTQSGNNSLLAKVVRGNTNRIVNNINRRKSNDQINKKDPALIRILQGSISVFNTVTGSEVEQLKVYDNKGKLKNYQLDTEAFAINKKFKPHVAE